MEIIMPLIFYMLEVLKYCLGNEIFFHGKVKQRKRIIWVGIFYLIMVLFLQNDKSLIYLLAYLWSMAAAVGIIEGNIYTKMWHTICILGITSCLEQIFGFGIEYYIPVAVTGSFIEIIITLIFFIIIKVIKSKKNKKSDNKVGYISALLGIALIIVCLILGMGVTILDETYKYVPHQVEKLNFDFMFILTYLSILLLIFIVLHIRNIHIKLEERARIEYELKIMQKNYFQTLLEKEEDTRRYRHDMSNHILCISQIAKEEQAWRTLDYVQDLQKELSLISKRGYNTGIEILDILLCHYLVGLENTVVSVKGNGNDKLELTDVDLCIIFSNLIQNAIEEIKKQEDKEKILSIEVKQGDFYTNIKIANSTTFILNESEVPVTQKKDRQNHGIGLKNVRETIERNGGKLELMADGNVFSAIVILKNDRSRS